MTVQANVRRFAQAQRDSLVDFEVETAPGVHLGQKHLPVAAAGAYVPGGRYPLTASAHMTIVTAKVAGVPRVAACTPPIRGEIPAATVAAMHLAGADEIYLLGGVQAVAPLALGTETIERVNLIAGPGNAYVAEAKRQLFGEVGIDLFAGPTEILDRSPTTTPTRSSSPSTCSEPGRARARLPRRARHHQRRAGASRRWRTSSELLPGLPTERLAGPAWRDYGQVLVVDDLDEAYAVADTFAAEHVQVLTDEPATGPRRRCTTTARCSSARAPASPTATR